MTLRGRRRGKGISLLVPFTPGVADDRDRIWAWLKQYWKHNLPGCQVVMGTDPSVHSATEPGLPFSKTAAVNAAAKLATGDVFVIIDADAYVPPDLIRYAVSEIREARTTGRRLWFVPYRHFYRVNQESTERVLTSDPRNPWHFAEPPDDADIVEGGRVSEAFGHHFGAMITIMPRLAFEEVGGMDPRFRSWGAEDVSFLRAVDTIYGSHKTINRTVFHLCHGTIGGGLDRKWKGQAEAHPFGGLGSRYLAAFGDRARMLRLMAEWQDKEEAASDVLAVAVE